MHARHHLVFGFAIFVAGCSALIGVKELTYDESADPTKDGGSSSGASGSSSSSSSSSGDAAGGDASCMADLTSDGKHCGRCGHDCGGGICADSKCQPFELSRDQNGPVSVAVDANNVYWANYTGAQVMTVPKNGGTPKQFISLGAPTALFYDAASNTLFYGGDSGDGMVRKCTPPDCEGTKKAISTGAYVQFIDVRGGIVYFSSENELRRVTVAGTDERVIGGAAQSWNVAVDEKHAYWTSNYFQLKRVPLDGGTQEDLGPIDGPDNANFVALDNDRYYWSSRPTVASGTVFSAAKTNPAVKMAYVENAKRLTGIAVDETYVYWLEGGTVTGTPPDDVPVNDGRLLACHKTGCGSGEPRVMAKDCKLGGVIVQDAAFLYWSEYGGFQLDAGRIRKVAKP